MTATAATPARTRPAWTRAAAPVGVARLLRIELRRNAMPWLLPLIAALFWFDSYRTSTAAPALWVLRTFWNMGQAHTIIDFGPFVAAVAAWMGSRDGRRDVADLATTTARPRWTAHLITWAATAIWAVGAYLVFVGVLFAVYAAQHVQGQPPWWWVAAGATAVAAFSAAGFVVGAFFPSRFAAPLAAFGGFLALVMSSQTGFSHTSGWAWILPTNSNGNFQLDSGTLYPYLPDLPIARIMLLAGLTLALLGVIGLPARAGGQALRRAAAVVTVAGLALAGTAISLVDGARLGPHGVVIPALHDAANDRLTAHTPVCGHAAGLPVCVDPAYRSALATVTAALTPVVSGWAGLPGAPGRAAQSPATYNITDGGGGQIMTISGQPPVLHLPLGAFDIGAILGRANGQAIDQERLRAEHAFVGAGNGPGTQAQQAVEAALLQGAGVPIPSQPKLWASIGQPSRAQSRPKPGLHPWAATGPAYDAARRIAALPAGTRHAWLAAHLAALRSGRLYLGQLP